MEDQTTTENEFEPEAIVVGVDGSDPSIAAVRWAANYARLSRLPLVAVTTWELPTTYGYPVVWPDGVCFEDDARQLLAESIEKAVGPDEAARVRPTVRHGHPATVLVDLSKGASLVVVGCRGHGELAGMLLGSVSEYLAAHAHCPVVIVRG